MNFVCTYNKLTYHIRKHFKLNNLKYNKVSFRDQKGHRHQICYINAAKINKHKILRKLFAKKCIMHAYMCIESGMTKSEENENDMK